MTNQAPFTVYQVVSAIIDGHLDGEIESLQNAIDTRRQVNTAKTAAMLKIGDKVRFQNGRPKYLNGCTATVVGKKQKNMVIKFDEGQVSGTRYTGRVTCSPSLLEPVNS